jgi:hypothetical protein
MRTINDTIIYNIDEVGECNIVFNKIDKIDSVVYTYLANPIYFTIINRSIDTDTTNISLNVNDDEKDIIDAFEDTIIDNITSVLESNDIYGDHDFDIIIEDDKLTCDITNSKIIDTTGKYVSRQQLKYYDNNMNCSALYCIKYCALDIDSNTISVNIECMLVKIMNFEQMLQLL